MNLRATPNPDNLQKFIARCEARAFLWQVGDLTLHDAVDELERLSREMKLDTDWAQLQMARAFSRVRDDLGGWVVP